MAVAHGICPGLDPANGNLIDISKVLTHLDPSIIFMALPAAFRTLFGVEAFLSDGVQIGRSFLARLKMLCA